jgi:hypothetical protein
LVVELNQVLAQALARRVFNIVLAPMQHLFDDDNNNNDDDAAFVSACCPRHRHRAAAALVWGLVVVLAWSLA